MIDFFKNYGKQIFGLILILLFAFYFTDILLYILIATFLSVLSMPMVRKLDTKTKLKHPVSVIITFSTILLIFVIFILFIVPLIIYQANVISSINITHLTQYYEHSFTKLNDFLIRYNIVNPEQTLLSYIEQQLKEFINVAKFTNIFTSLVSATGSVFMGLFIVLFLTFYFLLDESLVKNSILALTPKDFVDDMSTILHNSKNLLVRYFYGVLMEVGIMMTIESTALLILGVPNAILIGFFGGLLNVIPYLGPLIGATIGMFLAGVSELAFGSYDNVLSSVFYVAMTFLGANLIDNIILQPQIYSKSVKAQPVQIFLVILIGGRIAGAIGMIFAVPTFTVIRVFFTQIKDRVGSNKSKNIQADNLTNT